MPAVVVPFRAENAKQRLAPAPDDVREAVARSMLDDVLAACEALGPTYVAGGIINIVCGLVLWVALRGLTQPPEPHARGLDTDAGVHLEPT